MVAKGALLQAVLEEVFAAGSATSVADDSAELDTSEVEVGVCIFHSFFRRVFFPRTQCICVQEYFFTCLPVSDVGISYKCIPNPSRVLVSKNCLNRVGLK